ncbi:MAG TPA: YdeI/OmpD-associated family protein [Candidatus Limnocylindria bacterium]|nr:YdeI/OmpD-associated family protein [Candidatus Limnocylindria bacterium]
MADDGQAFRAEVEEINGVLVLRLSGEASAALPSRGMVMAQGTMDGIPFTAPAEPDGRGGHFIVLPKELAAEPSLRPGHGADVRVAPAKAWPEPEMPADFMEALEQGGLTGRWQACTVRGRWEWLRWLRMTDSGETRQRRVSVACDKLRKGEKRPCCFNASACTDMRVCKGGALLDA